MPKIFNRICEKCTACCKTHGVAEVHSLTNQWCEFCVIGDGCSIYESRPIPCKLYECFWLNGKGEDNDRPDKLKIVIDGIKIKMYKEEIIVVDLWELEKGAALSRRAKEITECLLKQYIVVRHRMPVSSAISSLRVFDKYFIPDGMFNEVERKIFLKKAKKR